MIIQGRGRGCFHEHKLITNLQQYSVQCLLTSFKCYFTKYNASKVKWQTKYMGLDPKIFLRQHFHSCMRVTHSPYSSPPEAVPDGQGTLRMVHKLAISSPHHEQVEVHSVCVWMQAMLAPPTPQGIKVKIRII